MKIKITWILFLFLMINILPILAQTNLKPVHVIITAGQSNTDGRVENKLLPEYIKSMASDNQNFTKGSYQYCKISQNRNDGQFVNFWPKGRITDGMWTYDAVTYYLLEQALKEDFYVIKWAVGGTSLQFPNDSVNGRYWSADADWLKETQSGERQSKSLLLSFTESIDAAIDNTLSKLEQGYQVDAFLWHQGESDDKYADKYYQNLKAVIAYVRNHLTAKTGKDYSKLPFIFGSIPKSNRHFTLQVELAMQQIAEEDHNAFLIDMSKEPLQKDRTHFNEKSAEYLGKAMFNTLEKLYDYSNTGFHVAKYRGDKQCAISYTFDDGLLEHATLVAPELEKYGFRGTFWINGNTVDKNDSINPRVSWEQLKQMSDRGHEISNHGWSHKNLSKLNLTAVKMEIEMNDSAILLHTGKRPVTFCYAFNSKNDSVIALASKNRVATRTKQYSIGGKSTPQNLESQVNELLINKDWGVGMTHGITSGYDHFKDVRIFWEHLAKVKEQEDKIWVGTFREIGAYIKEQKMIRYEVVKTNKGMLITPSLLLDKNLFNELLTGVVDIPGIKKITINQDHKQLKTKILSDKAWFNFNPYGGTIQVKIKYIKP